MSFDVELENVFINVGSKAILQDVSLHCDKGSFITLLGPSGSGKTTTLNAIAGFIKPSSGYVKVGGRTINNIHPQQRDMGIVFQNYALFPHMTAGENIEFPLSVRGMRREERRSRVRSILETVGLPEMEVRLVSSLSGGQQQRIALARALVFEPKVLLLDEPLSALDKQLRDSMQIELKRIQREVGVTTISVTHDQNEALTLSDKVAVLRDGRLEQFDSPGTLYEKPATRFVSEFLGEVNLFEVAQDGSMAAFGLTLNAEAGQVLLRPEDIGVKEIGDQGYGECRVRIDHIQFYGSRLLLRGQPVEQSLARTIKFYAHKESMGECLREGVVVRLVSRKRVPYRIPS